MELDKMRIALVTGAGSGIGEAVARTLLKAGWTVALTGRRRERLDTLAADFEDERTLVHPADVADPTSVAALFEPLPAARLPDDESPDSEGRPHHQQRLHLR
jgi:NADP-dependent 3-hydroxy acid dehydrogenase YdfG